MKKTTKLLLVLVMAVFLIGLLSCGAWADDKKFDVTTNLYAYSYPTPYYNLSGEMAFSKHFAAYLRGGYASAGSESLTYVEGGLNWYMFGDTQNGFYIGGGPVYAKANILFGPFGMLNFEGMVPNLQAGYKATFDNGIVVYAAYNNISRIDIGAGFAF